MGNNHADLVGLIHFVGVAPFVSLRRKTKIKCLDTFLLLWILTAAM